MMAISVDLPEPDGPATETYSASADLKVYTRQSMGFYFIRVKHFSDVFLVKSGRYRLRSFRLPSTI